MKTRNVIWCSGTALLIFIFCLSLSFQCWAQGPARVSVSGTASQKITLMVGKSTILELKGKEPIKRVTVGNPDIAEALGLTGWQIYLTGKAPGLTNLTVSNGSGKEFAGVFDIEVLPDITRLKEKIHEVLPQEEDVKVTGAHDSITLSGTVSGAASQSQIVTLAQAYAPRDKEGKPRVNNFLEVGGVHQVMLEVRVSEMARSTIKRLGFNWNYISADGRQFGISLLDNLTRLPANGFPANPLTVSDPINLIFRFLGDGATWTVFIDALKENGLTKVLAEPTLITLSGKTAHFLAGGEFPIPVPQSAGTGGTIITIDYKSFGVGLKFTPTVLGNGKISMQVAPEVSQLDFTNAVSLQGFVIPAITTRRVSTVIELADGQSFAVAGLLQDEVREVVRKYPLLGDIPVLGALFRSSSFQKNETELVIIVTPHLVKPVDMKKQTMPTDQYIEPDDFEFYLLGYTEGKGKTAADQGTTSAPVSLNKGGGLEGDFGHIMQ